MTTELRNRLGLLITILGAFFFQVVYGSVWYSFVTDTFQYDLDFGHWSSPNEVMESVANIVALVLISRYSVEAMRFVSTLRMRYQFALACILFGVIQWWTEPIVHYIGFAGRDNVSLFSELATRWVGFGRDQFFGMIAGSVYMVGLEYIRRLIAEMKAPSFGLLGSQESHV